MPKAKTDSSFSLESPEPGATSPEVVAGTPSPKPARKKAGIFVPIDPATGALDMSRATAPQIAALQNAMAGSQPDKKEEPKKNRPKINPKYVPQAYNLLEIIIQQAGKLLLKWPKELASEMHFSEDKKRALTEPTAELIDAYAPDWLLDNQAMAAFSVAFSDAINDMVQRGSERYVIKILRGECPPPPGFKFPPVGAQRPQQPPTPPPPVNMQPPPPPPSVVSGANGEHKETPPVSVSGRGFMPHIAAGTGIN